MRRFPGEDGPSTRRTGGKVDNNEKQKLIEEIKRLQKDV